MQTKKFKQNETETISENKKQEFLDKIKNFEYLRQERTARYQSIYIALLVAAIILFVDIVAGKDPILTIMLIILLVIIAELVYKKSLIQTQKPIFVCENAAGTVEKGPHYVKAEDGKEYAIFGLSDFVVKDDKGKR